MSTCCPPKSDAPVVTGDPQLDAAELAALCKAIAHPARVALLLYLSRYGACYFGSLADVLPLAPSTISQHVSILKQAGLIEGSADEQRVCYCINQERVAQLKQLVSQL